jgi:hypothetical protein
MRIALLMPLRGPFQAVEVPVTSSVELAGISGE